MAILWRFALSGAILLLYWMGWVRTIKQTFPHLLFPAYCVVLLLLLIGFHRLLNGRSTLMQVTTGALLGALAAVIAWVFVDGVAFGADGWFHGYKKHGLVDTLSVLGVTAVWSGGWVAGALLTPLIYRTSELLALARWRS